MTREMCDKCGSQSYSCPPFSPAWGDVKHKKYLAVLWWWIYLDEWHTIGSKYEHYATNQINAVLSTMAKRFGYILDEKFGTKFYSNGSCRICKPCRNKLGLPCAHPEKLRFALESMGVIVDSIVNPFGHHLHWKKRKSEGKGYLPKYTTVVIAIDLEYINPEVHNLMREFMKNEETRSRNS